MIREAELIGGPRDGEQITIDFDSEVPDSELRLGLWNPVFYPDKRGLEARYILCKMRSDSMLYYRLKS